MSSKPIEKLTLLEFQARFQDEESCIDHLFKLRWPEGFQCPKCGHKKYYWIAKRHLYQCTACGHQASITAGTVMHNTKLSLPKWFWAIYPCVTDKRGLSAVALKTRIGVSYPTAWFMLHKLRAAMAERDSNYTLSGLVEMDDAFVGGRLKHTHGTGDRSGRGIDKAPVIVVMSFIEGKPAFLKMKFVESISKIEVNSFTRKAIEQGSRVYTDSYKDYGDLNDQGYNHIARVYKEEGPAFLKWVHAVISSLKAFTDGTYHGLRRMHLQSYLDEFCYRFSRRRDPLGLFDRLAVATITGSHLKWHELVATTQSDKIPETC